MTLDASFGPWLQQRRKALGLTQAELAYQVGCATVTIHKIEIEERRPSKGIAERLAVCLHIAEEEHGGFLRFARGVTAGSQPTPLLPQAPPVPTTPVEPFHLSLPVPTTPLLGREHEVASLSDLLCRTEVRLVTLVGPGGIGKTRLALQVAAELSDMFAHGAVFVALAALADPALVVPTIMRTLGLTETVGKPLQEQLIHYLRDKQLLLVLDNAEHLLPAAPFISTLLAAAPSLTVLVTSRAVLHLSGEQQFPVPPLQVPDLAHLPSNAELTAYAAIRLFRDRAQAVNPSFQLTDAICPTVAELCARLDGLPLAIELAAARSKILSPPALLARLNRRLPLLTGGTRDLPARQQTLRATIDWSYHLLDPLEQTLFGRLAVFVGSCTLEAAEAVCNMKGDLPLDVLDGLQSLLDKSLLHQADGSASEVRFSMLETIREYALERLEASGEGEQTRERHTEFYAQLAEAAAPRLESAEQEAWLKRLDADLENLRAALSWSQAAGRGDLLLRFADALWRFWWGRGYVSEGNHWLSQALVIGKDAGHVDRVLYGKALAGASWLVHLSGEDRRRAQALSEECLGLGRELGDPWLIAFALRTLGWNAVQQGHIDRATVHLEESLMLARHAGDTFVTTDALAGLGWLALHRGDDDHATALVTEALELVRRSGFTEGIAWMLEDLGHIAYHQGTYERARQLWEESLALLHMLGNQRRIALILHELGDLAVAQGDYAAATARYEERLRIEQHLGNRVGMATALAHLGLVAHHRGDDTEAHRRRDESIALCDGLEANGRCVVLLEILARLTSALGQATGAARLFGAAEALRKVIRLTRYNPSEQATYERAVTNTRAQLDPQTFAQAWAEGRAMPLEQVIAYEGAADPPPPLPT